MTEAAKYLTTARTAAARARQTWKARDFDAAQRFFAEALEAREAATKADPEFADPAWEEDLLGHLVIAGQGRPRMRRKGQSTIDMVRDQNAELIAYYRMRLGQTENPIQVTSSQIEKAVIVPDRWELLTPGLLRDSPCRHSWQLLEGRRKGQRQCQGCDQIDRLLPTMPIEQTEAFQQLTREQARKQ